MSFGEIVTYVTGNWEAILGAVSAVVAAASAIAALTPSESDNVIVAKIRKVVDLLALNVGNAKNQ